MRTLNREFWSYITFAALGMLGSSGTIFADTFFVSGRLGADGFAALNIAIPVFGLINGAGLLLGVAARPATPCAALSTVPKRQTALLRWRSPPRSAQGLVFSPRDCFSPAASRVCSARRARFSSPAKYI